MKKNTLTIGTRGSKLALIYAEKVKNELKRNCHYMINDFWHAKLLKYIPNKYRKLNVISAIGLFYDLEDPSEFIKHAAEALDKDGIFVAQLMCSHSMFKTNDLGNICHEHLEYYSTKVIINLMKKNYLRVFDIKQNNINASYEKKLISENDITNIISKIKSEEIRGPKIEAPEQALEGFIRSNKIEKKDLYKKKAVKKTWKRTIKI